MPTFATAQFKRFFDCGRAVLCMLPVVLHGYQGADREAEKLALTDQLLDVLFRHVLLGLVVLRFVKLVGTLLIHLK